MSPGQIHEFFFSDRFMNGNLQIPPSRSSKLVFARHQNRTTAYRPDAIAVNGVMDAVAFKDDEFQSSIYVVAQINADSVLDAVDLSSIEDFYVRSRFFDADWQAEHSAADTIRAFNLPMIPGSRYRLFDVVRRYPMPFGHYNVAFAFEDGGGVTSAVFVGHAQSTRLIGPATVASDLLFLRSGTEGASIVRGGEVLLANASCAYSQGQALGVYFEVYNLSVVEGRSQYRLTFNIHKDPEVPPSAWNRLGRTVTGFVGLTSSEPAVAQTFDRVGLDHDAQERIAIDIGSLAEGRYRLVVTITDLHTGGRTETGKNFVKVGVTGQ
jgi:hypothetical protein